MEPLISNILGSPFWNLGRHVDFRHSLRKCWHSSQGGTNFVLDKNIGVIVHLKYLEHSKKEFIRHYDLRLVAWNYFLECCKNIENLEGRRKISHFTFIFSLRWNRELGRHFVSWQRNSEFYSKTQRNLNRVHANKKKKKNASCRKMNESILSLNLLFWIRIRFRFRIWHIESVIVFVYVVDSWNGVDKRS